MARLIGPLFSLDARGQFGQTLIYSKNHRTNYAKPYKIPQDDKTPLQMYTRRGVGFISKHWTDLTTEEKATWQPLADELGTSPYHAYLRFNNRRWADLLPPSKQPDLVTLNAADSTGLTTNGTKPNYQLEVAINTPTLTPWCIQIFADPTEPVTYDKQYLILAVSDLTFDDPLYTQTYPWTAPTETDYYFTARYSNSQGGPWLEIETSA